MCLILQVKDNPPYSAKPYYTLNQTYYLKESWQIISIIDYMDHPRIKWQQCRFYCDDLNLSNKDIAGELNSWSLFDNAMNEDSGLKMKSTPLIRTAQCLLGRHAVSISVR